MGTKMTHTARAELTNVVRKRYCAAASAEKRRILDEGTLLLTGCSFGCSIRTPLNVQIGGCIPSSIYSDFRT